MKNLRNFINHVNFSYFNLNFLCEDFIFRPQKGYPIHISVQKSIVWDYIQYQIRTFFFAGTPIPPFSKLNHRYPITAIFFNFLAYSDFSESQERYVRASLLNLTQKTRAIQGQI